MNLPTRCSALLYLLISFAANPLSAADPLRDLDSHAPYSVPDSLGAWQTRAADLKLQLQVATGLYPAPVLDPVQPQIYGKVERDGYTIEKCIFESLPGLFVTGNLYRPAHIAAGSQVPAILCPHGHWTEARFYEASQGEVNKLLAIGAERFETAARNHIQARCVQLARMGCIVFHWDMLGYCDSTQISFDRAHRFANQPAETEVTEQGWLLFSPLAEANLQSVVGLQTLAAQRAVDMLLTLPDVDANRIGITGASGGGTQSFLGAALDERIRVAFPAVMVSTGMQGGCTCENCCLLRTGTGNVEIASLIAPRPLGLTAANDWTKTMPQDGFPELKRVYAMHGAEGNVALFPALHFDHNFNHVARTSMYGWMSQHFGLGFEQPVLERDFELARRDQLTVWDAEHPQPAGGDDFERQLMKLWSGISEAQLSGLKKGDQQQQAEYQQILRNGWRVILGLTTQPTVVAEPLATEAVEGPAITITVASEQPQTLYFPVATAEQQLVPNPRLAAAYTYGYNLPVFAKQAHQLSAALQALAKSHPGTNIRLEATGAGGLLAAAAVFCAQQQPEQVAAPETAATPYTLAIEPGEVSFASAKSIRDPLFLPGSVRYGDIAGLLESISADK